MQTTAINDHVARGSVSYIRYAETAEWIRFLYAVETLGHPSNIVGPDLFH